MNDIYKRKIKRYFKRIRIRLYVYWLIVKCNEINKENMYIYCINCMQLKSWCYRKYLKRIKWLL